MKLSKQWSDVSIEQHQKLCLALKFEGEQIDKHIKILAALSDKTEEYFYSEIPHTELPKLIKHTEFIYVKRENKGIRTSLRIKGRRFRINPKVSDLSASDYIDLTTYVKDEDSATVNLHRIMAIFFIEVSFWGVPKKVTIKSQTEKAIFLQKYLTMNIVTSYSVFFLALYKKLIKATEACLHKEKMRMNKKLKQLNKVLLENTGVGL